MKLPFQLRDRKLDLLCMAGAILLAVVGLAGLAAMRAAEVVASVVAWVGMSWQTVASLLALLASASLAYFIYMRRENRRLGGAVAEGSLALAASEAKFRGIFTDAVEGIYLSTPAGRSVTVNPAMARLCGYDSPEDMVRSITDLDTQFYVQPDRRREVNGQLEREGALVGVESEIRRKDGRPLWVSENVRVVRDPATGETYYLGSMVDMTDKRTAREALRRALEAAEAADRTKSAFLANMSHELRTPLNSILGFARLLGRDPAAAAPARERLAIIESSGEHLLTLINEVLDYSKIEAGMVELHPSSCHLPGLLMSLADDFSQRGAEKGLRFRAETSDAELPRMVRVDEGKLRQVLLNLLGNALKFTDRGEICLCAERVGSGSAVRFTVTDTGVGIAPERQADIFLPFHQAASRARAAQGTGLGLSISRRLVELLGGELCVESAPERGSRFWFELNLPGNGENPAPPGERVPLSSVTGYGGPRRHLLVVDDDSANRQLARELLARVGFEVSEADGGERCLERFSAGTAAGPAPDLVLLDLRMAPLDGLETARRLRALPGGQGVKIVASSAGDPAPSHADALAAGCNDFVPKPLVAQHLLDAIGRLLGLEWSREEAALPATAPSASGNGGGQPPPAAELDALLALAEGGDLLGLRRELTALRERAPGHAGFVQRLESLAAGFQLGKIREELRRAREGAAAPPSL